MKSRVSPSDAQRRPGREPRRHRRGHPGPRTPAAPLNEGRGVNPGDTREAGQSALVDQDAQRRPGREPRRHVGVTMRPNSLAVGAQRRPGREPRRHWRTGGCATGTRTALNEGRGVNPGDTAPPACRSGSGSTALNEGRGVNPGDTAPSGVATISPIPAQRRPGREPRRHRCGSGRVRRACPALNEGRGVNPGDTVTSPRRSATTMTAQRRPGREPRRHHASCRRGR